MDLFLKRMDICSRDNSAYKDLMEIIKRNFHRIKHMEFDYKKQRHN